MLVPFLNYVHFKNTSQLSAHLHQGSLPEMPYISEADSETEPLNQKTKGDGVINKDAFIFSIFSPG